MYHSLLNFTGFIFWILHHKVRILYDRAFFHALLFLQRFFYGLSDNGWVVIGCYDMIFVWPKFMLIFWLKLKREKSVNCRKKCTSLSYLLVILVPLLYCNHIKNHQKVKAYKPDNSSFNVGSISITRKLTKRFFISLWKNQTEYTDMLLMKISDKTIFQLHLW